MTEYEVLKHKHEMICDRALYVLEHGEVYCGEYQRLCEEEKIALIMMFQAKEKEGES